MCGHDQWQQYEYYYYYEHLSILCEHYTNIFVVSIIVTGKQGKRVIRRKNERENVLYNYILNKYIYIIHITFYITEKRVYIYMIVLLIFGSNGERPFLLFQVLYCPYSDTTLK